MPVSAVNLDWKEEYPPLQNKDMLSGDSLALHNLTCEELTYGHSNGMTADRKTFIDTLVSKKVDFVTIEFKDQEITIKGDVAWVRQTFQGEVLTNGNRNAVETEESPDLDQSQWDLEIAGETGCTGLINAYSAISGPFSYCNLNTTWLGFENNGQYLPT